MELFGNKDKIVESKITFNNDQLYAYFLLKGNFYASKLSETELSIIEKQLPNYIPFEERINLLQNLDKIIPDIDAIGYDVVEVVCWYTGDSGQTFHESGKQISSIGSTPHFIAAPVYKVYYYNIMMKAKKDYASKNIISIHSTPHYNVPFYIKVIGDVLEKAVYKEPQR